MDEFFESLSFKKFSLVLRAKYESYGGDTKLKYFAFKVQPYSLEMENKSLLNRLQMYTTKEEFPGVPGVYDPINFGGYTKGFDM